MSDLKKNTIYKILITVFILLIVASSMVIMFYGLFRYKKPAIPIVTGEDGVDFVRFGKIDHADVEWLVLEKDGDGTMLLLSRYVLFPAPFNSSYADGATWENCSLREELNGEFFEKTFSAEEKEHILTTELTNPANPGSGVSGGNDTTDRLFVLSVPEAHRYFSFEKWDKDWRGSSAAMITTPIPSARMENYIQWKGDEEPDDLYNSDYWWLRSPGITDDRYVCLVCPDGSISHTTTANKMYGVRPAMRVK